MLQDDAVASAPTDRPARTAGLRPAGGAERRRPRGPGPVGGGPPGPAGAGLGFGVGFPGDARARSADRRLRALGRRPAAQYRPVRLLRAARTCQQHRLLPWLSGCARGRSPAAAELGPVGARRNRRGRLLRCRSPGPARGRQPRRAVPARHARRYLPADRLRRGPVPRFRDPCLARCSPRPLVASRAPGRTGRPGTSGCLVPGPGAGRDGADRLSRSWHVAAGRSHPCRAAGQRREGRLRPGRPSRLRGVLVGAHREPAGLVCCSAEGLGPAPVHAGAGSAYHLVGGLPACLQRQHRV